MSILRSFSKRVPVGISLGERLKPSLRFGGLMLQEAKSLSDYGIHHRCIHQFTKSILCQNEGETPNGNSKQHWPREQDQPFLLIWRNDYDKILLGLLVEHIRNGGKNILYCGEDSWCGIADKFNESTRLKCDPKYLQKRFKSYARQYEIINHIKHHEKFSWDPQRQRVIATEDDWNEYIERYPEAKFYENILKYFDLLEKVFGCKQELDQTFLTIWRNDYDKILLVLLIRNGGKNMLYCGEDSWCGIVDKFNESTRLKCDSKYLQKRFNSYARQYEIINHIKHHEKFSWDPQCQRVIATEDDWNEYIERYPEAKFYENIMKYFDLLEKVFGRKQEQETVCE